MNKPLTLTFCMFLAPMFCSALSVSIERANPNCTYASGGVMAYPSGGTPPYSYLWNNGETTQGFGFLLPGIYSVTVTDANSDQATAQVELFSMPYDFQAVADGLPWCTAPGNAFNDPMASGLTNTWTVNGAPTGLSPGEVITFLPDPGDLSYTYTVDDGNGCSGTITGMNGPQITSWPTLSVTGIDPSCDNEDIGKIRVLAASSIEIGLGSPYVTIFTIGGIVVEGFTPTAQDLELEFTALPPGDYKIHWWMGVTAEDLDPGECDYDTLYVTVPSIGSTCGSVGGVSYYDLNGDCVQDVNEVGIPYSPLLVQPSGDVVLTNGNGGFQFPLANGNYTLEQTDATLVPICPVTQPVAFTVNTDLTTIQFANGSTQQLDLAVDIAGDLFRPGFNTAYHLAVVNESPQMSGPVTVVVDLDPTLTYVSSEVTPTSQNGNQLTWDLAPFTSYAQFVNHITVQVPAGTALGTLLSTTAVVSNTLADDDPTNNAATANDMVVGSFDPNDKRAQTSTRSSELLYFIDLDEWVDYTIRFQNTGTFAAEFVVITDTIAPELDILTFEQGVASHPFEVTFKPGRVIEWRFDNINLPDSTSDEPGSHGLVKFRIRPHGPLVPGTEITNIANIYFDFNEPVITEASVLVATTSTGVNEHHSNAVLVYPDPAHDRITIQGDALRNVRILSADGRLVASHALNGSHTVNISALAPGTYVLQVLDAKGTVRPGRFVKE